jgi:predicted transposase YbfD/YdcC
MTLLILKLFKLLNLQGCLATIDVMGCHKKIAASALYKGADYLLLVKDNQLKLVKAL